MDAAKWADVAYMALSRLPQKTEADIANMEEIKRAFPAMIGLMTTPKPKGFMPPAAKEGEPSA
jgi:hypothetical protein